ncbi:hypothetical protein PG984_000343 [Apiospora sp. TS-2023a]
MESGPPEAKRPRLTAVGPSHWQQLPQPQPTNPPPPHSAGPHHPQLPPPQYQPPPPHHHPFSRPGELPHNPVQAQLDERRHHEPDRFAPPPIQEHHRHPPSPAHIPPPYHQYSREPLVKPDPAQEDMTLPQLRRPNSTGNAPDGLPPTPHQMPHPNHQQDDHRRPPSFDNGPQYPQSPAMYRPPGAYTPAPPTPVQLPGHYEPQNHGYGHHAPSPEVPYPAPVAIATAKRKAQRASQACDSCRQLKAKCDELKPCKNCKEKGIQCNYREPPAKQPDKVSADILEIMQSLKAQMTSIDERMSRMDSRVNSNLKRMDNKIDRALTNGGSLENVKMESTRWRGGEDEIQSDRETNGEPAMTKEAADQVFQQANEIEIEQEPEPPVDPGKPSMPANHTTLAGLLLKWPSIAKLVESTLQTEKIQHVNEFPIRQEQQRGLLRVHGKGEGTDMEVKNVLKEPHYNDLMTDVNDMDGQGSDAPTPPPGENWGQCAPLNDPNLSLYKGGPLNVDGTPDFDHSKVRKYVQSFKDNILCMHPIIVPKELDALVARFLYSLPRDKEKQATSAPPSAKFVGAGSGPSAGMPEAGTKRKRSPAMDDPSQPVPLQKANLPFRSIHSALVLSVLALGKICLHKGKLPDVVNEHDNAHTQSPSVRNGVPVSPVQGSQGSPPGAPPHPPQLSGLPSPKENERMLGSRRSSLQGGTSMLKGAHTLKRNLDVIPGLEYFALATDIVGSHIGGANLKHVYTWIFLGLYHGQLGRVMESWAYIALAGRTLLVCLRPSMSRLSRYATRGEKIGKMRDNQLAFAFWTCLQLESDILAELRVPQTGILHYEEQMPYPNINLALQGYSNAIMSSYSAQLYLRKQLNLIHELFYNPTARNDRTTEEKIEYLQTSLENSRHQWVPAEFTFNDSDPPAGDILSARLRAKYWGSQNILYRPFIDAILHPETSSEGLFAPHPRHLSDAPDTSNYPLPPNMTVETFPRALAYAARGINALIESTRAFHGLDSKHRLLVTNVFTTAHAQWGNLLCLAACYQHDVLSRFIPRELLAELLSRTIEFFRLTSSPSSPLQADMNMLVAISEKLGLAREELDPGTNSSFSSMTSTGPQQMAPPYGDYYSPGNGPQSMPPPHPVQ